jgi:hypothetical protein
LAREGFRDGFGETLDQQRMATIDVIVKNRHIPLAAPEFGNAAAERFALPQIPVERTRQHENFTGAQACLALKNAIEAVLTGIVRGVHGKRTESYSRLESQDARNWMGETFRLRLRAIPIGMVWKQVARDEKRRFGHKL